jgi:hypothetical protein
VLSSATRTRSNRLAALTPNPIAPSSSRIYYPIELDAALSPSQKAPKMIEWYEAVNGLLAGARISRADVRADVAAARIELRAGMHALLDAAAAGALPVTIFSAGIGDVIVEVLRQRWARDAAAPLPPGLRVVSNHMVFDGHAPEAVCVGWTAPLIRKL